MLGKTLIVIVAFAGLCVAVKPACAESDYESDPLCTQWVFNNVTTSSFFDCLVNVQSAEATLLSNQWYMKVDATGIPGYVTEMTSNIINSLNSRPKASSDFTYGQTTASVGDMIEFGQDIGYDNEHCSLGFWPPGPQCPSDMERSEYFPLYPTQSNATCYTTLGALGMWVNGVAVYNWWDGTSYDMQGVWHVLANDGEYYDLDICSGHAANGDYHHHGYPNCIGSQLGDKGASASPIYGFAADGVPIVGPYVSAGVHAESCWKKRDYDDVNSATGCGAVGKRTCLLVDQMDISQGTVAASSAGPDTDATVTTQSGNTFIGRAGYFFEDYYYDPSCTEQGDQYLDEHNGRYNSELGVYTYHITAKVDDTDGTIENIFPHFLGPSFYGVVDSNTIVDCDTEIFSMGGAGGGGQGGPPNQGPAPPGPPQQGPPPHHERP